MRNRDFLNKREKTVIFGAIIVLLFTIGYYIPTNSLTVAKPTHKQETCCKRCIETERELESVKQEIKTRDEEYVSAMTEFAAGIEGIEKGTINTIYINKVLGKVRFKCEDCHQIESNLCSRCHY